MNAAVQPNPTRSRADLLEWMITSSESIFAQDGEIVPVFFSVAEGKISIFMCPWRNEAEKQFVLETLREQFEQTGVTMYGHISEVWMKVMSSNEELERHRKSGLMISDYEDKEERVIYLVVDREGQDVLTRRIVREGESPYLSTPEACNSFEGRLLGLLPEQHH